jgi:hypothetical protein
MASAIDTTKPIEGTPTTASVRTNFSHAKTEIEALQDLDIMTWTNMSLVNSWVSFGGSYDPPAYAKDRNGIVHLRGVVKSGTVGAAIANLPAGFRPAVQQIFACASNGAFGQLTAFKNGDMFCAVGNNAWFSLSGISFAAA